MTTPRPALTLDAIAADPAHAAGLLPDERAALLAQACALIVILASNVSPSVPLSPAPERALRVAEAATMLSMSEDYLYRHWKTLGGYHDVDGHVKFAESDLRKHIERARRR
jgi:hypothetical protein